MLWFTALSISWAGLFWPQSDPFDKAVPESVIEAIQAAPPHIGRAADFVGRVEESDGPNSGPEVDMFLASVGLGTGYPYCAAFVAYILDEFPAIRQPTERTAMARGYISARSIRASEVLLGIKEVPPGTIVTFGKGNGIYGHSGFVVEWSGEGGVTIEANTSPGEYGSQRDGDGVWVRNRSIVPGNYFRIISFTPVEYDED